MPVILDGSVKIQLDHLKVAGSPGGRSHDVNVQGSDAATTFTKTADGWSITVSLNTETGVVGDPNKSSSITVVLNERAAVKSAQVSGQGSVDAAMRNSTPTGPVIASIAYVVYRP